MLLLSRQDQVQIPLPHASARQVSAQSSFLSRHYKQPLVPGTSHPQQFPWFLASCPSCTPQRIPCNTQHWGLVWGGLSPCLAMRRVSAASLPTLPRVQLCLGLWSIHSETEQSYENPWSSLQPEQLFRLERPPLCSPLSWGVISSPSGHHPHLPLVLMLPAEKEVPG